jgi:hypothetical protein
MLTSAFAMATDQSLADFILGVPGRVLAGCSKGITLSDTRPDGLVVWRIYGFGSLRTVEITADGSAHYAFRVVTGHYGVSTGALGGPMPAGTYTLRATATSDAAVQISLVLGGAAVAGSRACT